MYFRISVRYYARFCYLFIATVQAGKGALVSLADGYAFDLEAGTYCVVDQTMLDYQVR